MNSTTDHKCPNIKNHTKMPEGYREWHDWAEKKSKTHHQILCEGCGNYQIWVKGVAPTERDIDDIVMEYETDVCSIEDKLKRQVITQDEFRERLRDTQDALKEAFSAHYKAKFEKLIGEDEPEYIKVEGGYAQPIMEDIDYYLLCGRNQIRANLREKLKGDK